MGLAAVSLVITWVAHLALAFLPASTLVSLLLGKANAWVTVLVVAAVAPQLYLIPWALRDSGERVHRHTSRLWWRIGFIVLGFLAVSLYLWRNRVCPGVGGQGIDVPLDPSAHAR